MFLNAVSAIEPSISPEIWHTAIEFISKLVVYTMPAFLILGVLIGGILFLLVSYILDFIKFEKEISKKKKELFSKMEKELNSEQEVK